MPIDPSAVPDPTVVADNLAVATQDGLGEPPAGRSVLRWTGWVLVVGGAVGATVGAFLPWLYSGAASRNSFGVVRAARRLGIVESDVLRAALLLWYFVPLIAAVAVFLLAVRREQAAGAVALVFGLIVFVIGLMVAVSPADVSRAPASASAAGAIAVLGGGLVVWTARREGSGGRA